MSATDTRLVILYQMMTAGVMVVPEPLVWVAADATGKETRADEGLTKSEQEEVPWNRKQPAKYGVETDVEVAAAE